MRAIILLGLVLSLFSCKTDTDSSLFTIITWNSYLFFDGVDNGNEYQGFRRSDGYTGDVYRKRIKSTALMMAKSFSDADVIVLEEIESANVLCDLLSAGLKEKGFCYYTLASDGSTNLSVGIISKHKPQKVAFHGTGEGRIIIELSFELCGEQIVVAGIHARSRLSGGEDEREKEFAILRSIADESPECVVVLAGDFNSDPRIPEKGMSWENNILSLTAPIVVTGDGGVALNGVFFSQALDNMVDVGKGTYVYQGQWFFYDNILFTQKAFDGRGWEYLYSEILKPMDAMDLNYYPVKFDLTTGKGFSDHFPLKSVLRYNP